MDEKKKKLAGLGAVSLIGIASAVGIFSVVSNKVANSNNDKVTVETLAGKEATNPNRQNEGEAFNVGELDVDVEAPSYEDLPKETITETGANGETVQHEYGVVKENSDGSKILMNENGAKRYENAKVMQTIEDMHIERVTAPDYESIVASETSEAPDSEEEDTDSTEEEDSTKNEYMETIVEHGSEADTQDIKYVKQVFKTDEGYTDGMVHGDGNKLTEDESNTIDVLRDTWIKTDITETQFKEYFTVSCKDWLSEDSMNKIMTEIMSESKRDNLYKWN